MREESLRSALEVSHPPSPAAVRTAAASSASEKEGQPLASEQQRKRELTSHISNFVLAAHSPSASEMYCSSGGCPTIEA